MSRILPLILASLALSVTATTPSLAAYQVITDPTAFLSAAGPHFDAYDFDAIPAGTQYSTPPVLDGVTYNAAPVTPGQPIVGIQAVTVNGVGVNALQTNEINTMYLYFGGGSVGVLGLTLDNAIGQAYAIDVAESDHTFTTISLPAGPPSTSEFIGLVEEGGPTGAGFAEIAITPLGTSPGNGSPGYAPVQVYEVDRSTDITPGDFPLVTPEPTSLLLLSIGLAYVGVAIRRPRSPH